MMRINKKNATRALTLLKADKFLSKSKRSTPAHTRDYVDHFVSCKRSQEEMVGFALIIIIVAVILIIFLGFSLRTPQKEAVEDYEVNSFIQAVLQYTTDCRDNLEYLSIQKLIFNCNNEEICLDERDTCDVLNSTLAEIIKKSWKIEGDRPVKGYELSILSNKKEILMLKEGNITQNYKGAMQDFNRGGNSIEVYFTAYY